MAYMDFSGFQNLADVIKTWTAEQIASAGAHYEPKLRFDPVPVYSVTLAEDVEVTSQNNYVISGIDFGKKVLIACESPNPGAVSNILVRAYAGANNFARANILLGLASGNTVYSLTGFTCNNGLLFGGWGYSSGSINWGGWQIYSYDSYAFIDSDITSIAIGPATGGSVYTLKAGMKITIYSVAEV